MKDWILSFIEAVAIAYFSVIAGLIALILFAVTIAAASSLIHLLFP